MASPAATPITISPSSSSAKLEPSRPIRKRKASKEPPTVAPLSKITSARPRKSTSTLAQPKIIIISRDYDEDSHDEPQTIPEDIP